MKNYLAAEHPRPRTREKALILILGILAVLIFGLSYFLWNCMAHCVGPGTAQTPNNTEPSPSVGTAPLPASPPVADAQLDVATIKQSMASCDEDAAKNPDGLYFLVIPVVPATFEAATLLMPAGENYEQFVLISSTEALAGLENGSLAPSSRSYGFSIRDLATRQAKQLGSAAGPFKFTQPNAPALSNFRVGLDLPGKVTQWSNDYPRKKGICYWVNVRFRL